MLSLRSILRGADMHFGCSSSDARKIPSTSIRAGSSRLKSLRMTPSLCFKPDHYLRASAS
jgi:hypothetical protein